MTATGWANAIVAAQPGAKPADFNLAEGVMRYLVLDPPQPEYDTMKLDYDRRCEDGRALEQARRCEGNRPVEVPQERRQTDHDLRLGGPDSPAVDGREVLRGRRGEERQGHRPSSSRLFMVPGMAHCGGGVGPDRNDAVTAVIDWVEKGKAPDQLIASKVTNGQVVRTRPLCPYPQVARYKGQGSIDDAANFSCVAPR